MEVNYQVTREDYEEVCRVQGARFASPKLIWIGCGLTAVAFVLLVKQADLAPWLAPGILLLVGLGVLVVPIWSAYAAVERGWRTASTGRAARPVTVTIEEEGISKASALWSAQIQWPAYGHFRETRGLLLLFYDDDGLDLAEMLPKRTFRSDAEIAAVTELIRAKVGRVRKAFEVVPPRGKH